MNEVPTAQSFPVTRKRDGRKARRKHYKITILNPRMAKGRYPKGQGFNKGAKAKRQPQYVGR